MTTRGKTRVRVRGYEALALAIAAACAVSCGGDSTSGASCSGGADCGGDITGRWRAVSVCTSVAQNALDPEEFPEECRADMQRQVATARSTPQNLTFEFMPDGTFQESGAMLISMSLGYSASCFQALTQTPLTAEVCEQVGEMNPSETVTFSGCTFGGGACTCSASMSIELDATGTYSTNGGTITLGSSEGTYCVTDDQASISASVDGSAAGYALTRE